MGEATPAGLDREADEIGDDEASAEAEREVLRDIQPHGAQRRIGALDFDPGQQMARCAETAAGLFHELADILERRRQGAEDARAEAAFFLRHCLRLLHIQQRFDLLGEFVALRRVAQGLQQHLQILGRRLGLASRQLGRG